MINLFVFEINRNFFITFNDSGTRLKKDQKHFKKNLHSIINQNLFGSVHKKNQSKYLVNTEKKSLMMYLKKGVF